MLEVTLNKTQYNDDTDTVENVQVVYRGVVGFQAGNCAIDLQFYNNSALMIPFDQFETVFRRGLTDDEILNGEDKEFAAWYSGKKAEYEEQEAAKAAAVGKSKKK